MSSASTSLSRDELIAAGRDALLAGDHARARQLLDTAVRLDPRDAEAWMWLSGAQTEPAEMAACLNRALALDPNSHQAREGLRWIAETYGDDVAYGRHERPVSPAQAPTGGEGAMLAHAAVYPFAAGALLGLTRLAGWLRPEMLEQQRAGEPALGFGGALLLAIVAAVGHGTALVLGWVVLGVALGAMRRRGRGDRFDSLVRAGTVFEPGLLWGAALGIAAFGLIFAPLVWPAVVLLCWVALAAGAGLMALRLRSVCQTIDVARKPGILAATACVVVAALGCWLAGRPCCCGALDPLTPLPC